MTADLSSLKHRVIAVTGQQARKLFFTDHSLNLDEGYKILWGSAPLLGDINIQPDGYEEMSRSFVNRLLLLLRKDRVADSPYYFPLSCLQRDEQCFFSALPLLLDDVHTKMLDWGRKGEINPFKEVYDVCPIPFIYQPSSICNVSSFSK